MQPVARSVAAKRLVWMVVASFALMAAVLATTDISLNLESGARGFTIIVFVMPLLLYSLWRRMTVLPETFCCIIAVLAMAIPVLVWTYAAMNVNQPLADARLAALDKAIGFDWRAFVDFVDAWPMLADGLAFAYSSFAFQLLLLPFLLALAGRSARAFAMVFVYGLIGLVSSIVSVWYPSLGAFVYYGVTPEEMASINMKFAFFFLDEFHAVRADGPFELFLEKSAGIITYPSVHAAVAALCAWAAWDLKLLRIPFLVLNTAMAISAVTHGSHYLVDVIAGVGLAGLCIAAAMPLFYSRLEDRSPVFAMARNLLATIRPARVTRRSVRLMRPPFLSSVDVPG